MGEWLLTETFMADLIRFRHEVKDKTQVVETGSDFMVIAKAQAKRLVEWGDEVCYKHKVPTFASENKERVLYVYASPAPRGIGGVSDDSR